MESLCKNCYRVYPSDQKTCSVCGGQTCGCLTCRITLYLLRKGEKDSDLTGIDYKDWTWSEDGGLVIKGGFNE